MISLSSEITDTKGRRAECGWVFFDRECRVCRRMAERFRGALGKRVFGLAALQDPRAAALLALPQEEMLQEMRVVSADGGVYGGADAIVYLAGRIWWAWPVHAMARAPGARRLLGMGYQWFAAHRRCSMDVGEAGGMSCERDFMRESRGGVK